MATLFNQFHCQAGGLHFYFCISMEIWKVVLIGQTVWFLNLNTFLQANFYAAKKIKIILVDFLLFLLIYI